MEQVLSVLDEATITAVASRVRSPEPSSVPTVLNRAFWEDVSTHPAVQELVGQARERSKHAWPLVPAQGYLRYARDGDRIIHEEHIRQRQERLTLATLAAALTDEREWIDEVTDGVILLCEQTSWCWPAHEEAYSRGHSLPVVTSPTLDLGAGEVAAQLAWIDHVLGPRLDKYAPGLRIRIRHEVHARVITPFLTRTWHWLGLDGNIHNWNPWIHQNILTAALFLIEDPISRSQVVERSLRGLDIYLGALPTDGAIDEGFDYWWNGACRALEALSIIDDATGGDLHLWGIDSLRATLEFPHSMWLGGRFCYSFSDSHPPINKALPWHLLHRWARQVGSDMSAGFALRHRPEPLLSVTEGLGRLLAAINDPCWLNPPTIDPPALTDSYLPSTQVFVAHRGEFSLGAKGGHNDENHNHLDVGSVMCSWRGIPILVDPGRETYSAKTFSDARYELWYTRSDWHNVPSPAGESQMPGSKYRARVERARVDQDPAAFTLGLSEVYPVEGRWNRSVSLGGGGVEIRDSWSGFEVDTDPHHITWVIAGTVTELGAGTLQITPMPLPAELSGVPSPPLVLTWNPVQANATIDHRDLTDPYQRSAWGSTLTRVRLTLGSQLTESGQVITSLGPKL